MGSKVPVHQMIQIRSHKVSSAIAKVNVVTDFTKDEIKIKWKTQNLRVLPDVNDQQRLVGGGERGQGVARVDNVNRSIGLSHQPGPSRSEISESALGKLGLEVVDVAPLLGNGI